jgi:hypothetical protein
VLVIAVGARAMPAFPRVTTFGGPDDVELMHGLVQDVEMGYVQRIAFVVPPGIAWSLPLYELALMTARRAYEMNVDVEITFVTPEERPLPVFGAQPSADVAEMLDAAQIRVHTSTVAEIPRKGTVVLHPGGETVEVDRVVALSAIEAIPVRGLPTDADGFLTIDSYCRVAGVNNVYAAGDGTNFPIKQGGIATQQADVAAEHIAREAGVPVEAKSFRPVLRGELLTGQKARFMHNDISGRAGDRSESSDHMLWWPPTKVAGRYLAPYLAEHAGREQHAQTGLAPVDEVHGHGRRVVAARRQVVLVERVGGERAGDLAPADREAELLRRFRGGEAGPGAAGHAVDDDVLVMLGEALDDAVAPRHDPAARERRDAAVELRLQPGRNASHGLISTSGMRGTLPAANAERSTSR